MSDQFDTDYTDYPVCPHCGAEDHGAWELEFNSVGMIEHECIACDKPIRITRHIDVSYTTEVMP